MNRLPAARSRNVIEQELDKELLIYDLQTNTAYSLNETSKIIYRACSENLSYDDLQRRHNFDADLINFALDELHAKNLLENYTAENFAGMNRREVIRKVGLASMVALPVIAAIVAPKAAYAASSRLLPNGAACTTTNPAVCASGNCSGPKQACCNRTSGGSSDGAPCTSEVDCCLATTTSTCQGGICCRRSGAISGFAPSGAPALCCSGVCNYSGANNTGSCICT